MLHMFVRFRLGKVWLTSNQKYCLFVYIFFSGTVKIELWLFLRCRFIDLFSIPGKVSNQFCFRSNTISAKQHALYAANDFAYFGHLKKRNDLHSFLTAVEKWFHREIEISV